MAEERKNKVFEVVVEETRTRRATLIVVVGPGEDKDFASDAATDWEPPRGFNEARWSEEIGLEVIGAPKPLDAPPFNQDDAQEVEDAADAYSPEAYQVCVEKEAAGE